MEKAPSEATAPAEEKSTAEAAASERRATSESVKSMDMTDFRKMSTEHKEPPKSPMQSANTNPFLEDGDASVVPNVEPSTPVNNGVCLWKGSV